MPAQAITCGEMFQRFIFNAKYVGEKINELPYYNVNQLRVLRTGAMVFKNIKSSSTKLDKLSGIIDITILQLQRLRKQFLRQQLSN